MDQPAAAPAHQTSLHQLLVSAEPWGEALYAALDGPSRLALAHTGPAYREWSLAAAQQATIGLLAYGGLSEAAWQRRFARAQQALALRAQQGRTQNSLALRLATPNPAALQALLTIAGPAGSAVTELRVLQEQSNPDATPVPLNLEGVRTQWLRELGRAFPNLRTLRVSRLCGCLPSPTHLPHLTELQIAFYPAETPTGQAAAANSLAAGPEPAAGPSREQMIASIAPYLTQLTTVDISGIGWDDFKSLFLPITTTTLQRLVFGTMLDERCVELLCKYAPALEHVSCWGIHLIDDLSSKKWGVRELRTTDDFLLTDTLAKLPQSPEGLLLQPCGRPDEYHLTFHTVEEGLPEEETQRLQQWRVAAPCRVQLVVGRHDAEADISAALQQLAAWLPAGAVLEVNASDFRYGLLALEAVADQLAEMAEQYPQVTIVAPAMSRAKDIAALVKHKPAIQHARIRDLEDLQGSEQLAKVRWPWQTLHITRVTLQDILCLPNPSKGNYELHVECLSNHSSTEKQWTPKLRERVLARLQHLSIHFKGPATISIKHSGTPYAQASTEQPGSLRSFFELLSATRLHCTKACARLEVQLEHWTLTPSLITELSNLPSFPVPCTLVFLKCEWLPVGECDYGELPRIIPTCYDQWKVVPLQLDHEQRRKDTVDHYRAIGSGASARGAACARLRLQVCYSCEREASVVTDAQRSDVEAYIDQQGLGRWVEMEWLPDFE